MNAAKLSERQEKTSRRVMKVCPMKTQYERVKVRALIDDLKQRSSGCTPNAKAQIEYLVSVLDHGSRSGRDTIMLQVGELRMTALSEHFGIPDELILDDAAAWREQRRLHDKTGNTLGMVAVYDVAQEDASSADRAA